MTRLDHELQRLYLSRSTPAAGHEPTLIDAHGATRALVLEVARPAEWEALDRVWRGVQTELALPAPAIAVNGVDGYQLWLSLAEAVPQPRAQAFLEKLRLRWLPGLEHARVRLLPAMPSGGPAVHARPVPSETGPDGRWSAFVMPDLAALFADTPWLDFPPGADGQADLLRRLASIEPADFEAAETHLGLHDEGASDAAREATPAAPSQRREAAPAHTDPRRFLLQVMNNDTAPLALRIEAAKALLPYREAPGRT